MLAASAAAQSASAPVPDFSTYAPTAEATRIAPDETPTIDGDLSDPAWSRAFEITEFYQVDPREGAPPSHPTRALLMYDETTLYVGVHAYDDPALVTATIQERDGDVQKDDVVRIAVDSFNSRRNGYLFETNPFGSRSDKLLQNNNTQIAEWDAIWNVATRIVDDGWIAEFAIPFRSISYDAAAPVWGLQIQREIRRLEEEIRWASISRTLDVYDLSREGTLAAPEDIRSGIGLDVQMFGAIRTSRDWAHPRDDDVAFEPSGNVFYKITPSLTGTLTFNTDFSDTPLDERQINTGRFALFYPETRDFFLQDAAVFEFGGEVLAGGDNPQMIAENRNGAPIFTRRIGIVDGEVADITAGGKLSGTLGGADVGLLSVATDETASFEGQQLTVGRVALPVLAESKVGAVFTNGDPTGLTENTVGGVDFQYRDSAAFNGRVFQADFYYMRSSTEDAAETREDDSFGFNIAYPNDRIGWAVNYREIGEDFNTALGFTNRTGIRRFEGRWRYRWRPTDTFLRRIDANLRTEQVFGLDGLHERRRAILLGSFQTNADDVVNLFVNNTREIVREDFFLPRGVIATAGTYEYTRLGIRSNTSAGRPLSFRFDADCCGFEGGEQKAVQVSTEWRPSRFAVLAASHSWRRLEVRSGDAVSINISSLDATANLTPDMQIATQLQYDNISEGLNLFARYRWEPRPGTEVLFTVGESADLGQEDFPQGYRSVNTSATLRVGHTFRF